MLSFLSQRYDYLLIIVLGIRQNLEKYKNAIHLEDAADTSLAYLIRDGPFELPGASIEVSAHSHHEHVMVVEQVLPRLHTMVSCAMLSLEPQERAWISPGSLFKSYYLSASYLKR